MSATDWRSLARKRWHSVVDAMLNEFHHCINPWWKGQGAAGSFISY